MQPDFSYTPFSDWGSIILDSSFIEQKRGRRRVRLLWQSIHTIRYGMGGSVTLEGPGGRIRFNEQIDGYEKLLDRIRNRAPQHAFPNRLTVPFDAHLSWFSYIAVTAGAGIVAILIAALRRPDSNLTFLGLIFVFSLVAILARLTWTTAIYRIHFGRDSIIVQSLFGPRYHVPVSDLRRIRTHVETSRSGIKYFSLRIECVHRTISIGSRQFREPREEIMEAIIREYLAQPRPRPSPLTVGE